MARGLVLFGVARCVRNNFTVLVGTKQLKKRGKKTGEEIPEYERFNLLTPIGYEINFLRRKVRNAVRPLVMGRRNSVELVLQRWPQVATVVGEVISQLPKGVKLTFGWTTNEEGNTLFVIERV